MTGTPTVITCREERLRVFCDGDAYWAYDYWGAVLTERRPNRVGRRELLATNSAMFARSPLESWPGLLDADLPELALIRHDADLPTLPDEEWASIRGVRGHKYRLCESRTASGNVLVIVGRT